MQMTVDIWVTGILVLMMFSFMIKETVFYRFGEYTLIGGSGGQVLLGAYKRITGSAIQPVMEGQLIYIVGLVLGVLILARFTKEYTWVSRYPMSILIGLGVGILIPTMTESDIIEMTRDTMTLMPFGDPMLAFNNLVTLVIVVTVVWFFVFTREPKTQVEDYLRTFARYMLMATFGVGIGASVMEYAARTLTGLQLVIVEWWQLALVKALTALL